MTPVPTARPGRGGARRLPGRGLSTPAWRVLVVSTGVLLAACSGSRAATTTGPAAPDAGRYAIATAAPQPQTEAVASTGHYQLVSAGDPVHVELGNARVLVQMSGPELDQSRYLPGHPPPRSAPGIITVTMSAERGALDVPSSTFLTLGERQNAIAVRPDQPSVHLAPGHPATLHLATAFPAGHTTLTWQPHGAPLVTWDFVVEPD